jgi:uncharacterized lipoprotein YehR (DUF1307 family)
MKCSNGVIAGVLVVLLAACGSNAPKSTTPPPAHASTSATTPPPDLNAELLSISDLPAGWSVEPSSGSTSTTPQCLANIKTDVKATSKAEATFVGGSNGVPILDELLGYEPGQAQSVMTFFSHALSGCGQISITSGGQTLTGTVGAMSFPAVADQSSAYQMNLSGTFSGVSLTFGIDLIAFRKADTVALILYGDLGTPDISALENFVQHAAAKLS